jgi:uncharacterized protein (DUF486 family)
MLRDCFHSNLSHILMLMISECYGVYYYKYKLYYSHLIIYLSVSITVIFLFTGAGLAQAV